MAQGKPNSCIVCDHSQVTAIDRAIMAGDSLRAIATVFATSKDAIYRHKNVCMQRGTVPVTPPADPPEYKTAVEVAKNEDLRKWSRGILGKAISFMNAAEAAGDLKTAISAVRAAKECIDLLGRVQGDLGPNQTAIQVNVINNPQWLELRTCILNTLQPFPEARAAIVAALKDQATGRFTGGERK